MAAVAPPVSMVHRVSAYPNVQANRNFPPVSLTKDLLKPGVPCVIHLYTG